MNLNTPFKKKLYEATQWVFGQYEDFGHGRGFFGKITSFKDDIQFLIILCTLLFGIDLSDHISLFVKWVIIGIVFLYLFGKMYRRTGMLELEQRAVTYRNPIGNIQLRANELIIAKFGGEKDYEKQIREKIQGEFKSK